MSKELCLKLVLQLASDKLELQQLPRPHQNRILSNFLTHFSN